MVSAEVRSVAGPPLKSRREFLESVQNPDGGWGYFPGKRSWLEPTVYAAAALHGTPAGLRAMQLVRSWSLPEGGWRTSADVPETSWASSLAVSLYCLYDCRDTALRNGVNQLVRTIGAEGGFLLQLHHQLHPEINDIDCSLQGWPWRPGTSSWIEPTAHAVLALRNAACFLGPGNLPNYLGVRRRVSIAEQMLMERRTTDGGWNVGTHRVRGVDLPSYPETTALALIALQRNAKLDIGRSMETAARWATETRSPLARAWLSIALKMHGNAMPPAPEQSRPSQDILLAAVQALDENGFARQFFHWQGASRECLA